MASSLSMPPPIGGWDARESLADMPEDHAVYLDNWFPDTDKITVRRGCAEHSDSMPGPVETVIEYTPQNGQDELFSASGNNIYDTTIAGSVGAPVVTGQSNDRYQFIQMGNAAGQFVRLFNGEDIPLIYDGTTWGTTPAITGPTVENLIWCNIHQNRMWFGEKDSLDAWYLEPLAVGGAATLFPLAGVFHRGGFIMTMGTWTRDAGDGMDDVACFISSEGEVAVYQGTDPTSPSTWGLIGNFHIGKPIGRRCIEQGGSDLLLVTQDGFVPLSAILTMDRSQSRLVALSDQINKAVNEAVRDRGDLFGWQPKVYPKGTMLVFNVPISSTEFQQYVFNTITGAPCRFKGLAAISWGMLEDDLYFGTPNGEVCKFDVGITDPGGVPVETDALQAFSYFSTPNQKKTFKMAEPIFESAGSPDASVVMNTDFNLESPPPNYTPSTVTAALWGISKWGIGTWGTGNQIYRGWRGVRGVGRTGAIRIRTQNANSRPSWIATNYTITPGGQV